MKNVIIFIACLAVCLILSACAVPSEEPNETSTENGSAADTAAASSVDSVPESNTEAMPGETAQTAVPEGEATQTDSDVETQPSVTEAETEAPLLGSFLLTDRLPELAPEPLTLEEMYFLAEDIVAMGKAIGIEKNQFTKINIAYSFSKEDYNSDVVEETEETYWLRSAEGDPARKKCVYAVFLAIVLTHQPENVMDFDVDYNSSYNRHNYYTLLYSEDFGECGYDTIEAYRAALLKQECAPSSRTFFVYYFKNSVTYCADPSVEVLDKWVRQ